MNLIKIIMVLTILTTLGGSFTYMLTHRPKHKTKEELYKEYFNPYIADYTPNFSRGYEELIEDDNPIIEMRAQGMAAYGSKNYSGAIKLFEDYLTKATNDLGVPFYLGISYMATENLGKAEGQFNRLLQHPNGLYYDYSQWYAALIAINKADYSKSIDLLNKVIANRNHYFQELAEELLDQVEYLSYTLNFISESDTKSLFMKR